MKNITFPLIAFISLLLPACGEKKTESPVATASDTPQVAVTRPTEQQPVVYFEGAGENPDWKLTIYSNPDGSFLISCIKEGQSEIKWTASKEPLYVDGKVNTASGEVKLSGKLNDGNSAQVSMITGACKDAAGREHTHACRYESGKEILKGCGDYKE
jgi:hypothetical protein